MRVKVYKEERLHFPGGWEFSSLVSLSQTLDSSPWTQELTVQ